MSKTTKSSVKMHGTPSRVGAAASAILKDPKASKAAKSVAASALTQAKGKGKGGKIYVSATSILKDPKASEEARTVAASALTQWPAKPPKSTSKVLRILKTD